MFGFGAAYITLVAFDLETTGLSSNEDDIIEVAAVKFTFAKKGDRLEIVEKGTFESFTKPDRLIPSEATAINHITNEMVENAPPITEVLPNFIRFCGLSSVLVAHNASFDAGFMAKTLRRKGLAVPKLPILDSLKLARHLLRESGTFKLGEIAQRLAGMGEIELKLDEESLHRALYDCRVLTQVMGRMVCKCVPEKELAMDKFLKAVERSHGPAMILDQVG